MTVRQRFRQCLEGANLDRLPLFDEGIREEVLKVWQAQGIDQADLQRRFTYDRRESVNVDFAMRPGLKQWPAGHFDLTAMRDRFDPNDTGRFPSDWQQRVERWGKREHILEMYVYHGLFPSLGVGDWSSLYDVLCLMADEPATVRSLLEMQAELAIELVRRVVSAVDIDCVAFSEPIAGNDGPLISPTMYRDLFVLPFQPLFNELDRLGIATRLMFSYANPSPLLRTMVDAGINCLWICEANPKAIDYLRLRRELGHEIGLIGGIDLDLILEKPGVLQSEFDSRVEPLVAQGRYIPLADGRVRANMSFHHYAAYRERLEATARLGRNAP